MSHTNGWVLDEDLLYDRAFGCLIGLAIGDSLGDQARSPENHASYGITRSLQLERQLEHR